jgi:hypothetical protein
MKSSRPAIIGFYNLTHSFTKSLADKWVEHKDNSRFIRYRPVQHVSSDTIHILCPQPRLRLLYIASRAFREFLVDLDTDYASVRQSSSNEEHLPLA